MASKGRVPPPHLRRPLPGPGVVHPDPYASGIRPPLGGFPPFEMLPPPEVMAQKLTAQHIEIEKLATENRRLAATHGTLRQDLATAKHDLQLVHAHIADVKSEKEQQMRGIIDKLSIMESELEAAEPIKKELQQARAEAQSLVATRQELILNVQQLTRDLQMAHSEAQQIPSLMAELDSLRQEYQHCRATYDYEKKLYNDHLESLQVMEKNYMAMSREVDKLRGELTNSANFDPRTGIGGPYGGSGGYNESVPVGNYASGQNAYGVGQGQGPLLGGGNGGGPAGVAGTGGNSPHVVAQSAPYGSGTARDASRGPVYSASRGTGYDPHRGHAGAGYDTPKVMLEQVMMLREYKPDLVMMPKGVLLDLAMMPRGDLDMKLREDIDLTPRRDLDMRCREHLVMILVKGLFMMDKVLLLMICKEVQEMKFNGQLIMIRRKALAMMHHLEEL
ncbi:hypothetical protein Pfo_008807 [Paulownia fortunei]|nr:hypothetical protein Pfo_008807 [Paulownia fortunei]